MNRFSLCLHTAAAPGSPSLDVCTADGCLSRFAEKRCGPWFDKLTMRSKPLISLDLILSLSKDGAKLSFHAPMRATPPIYGIRASGTRMLPSFSW